jgi:hypothetical protein
MTFFRTTDRCEREQDRTQSGPVDAGSLLGRRNADPEMAGLLEATLAWELATGRKVKPEDEKQVKERWRQMDEATTAKKAERTGEAGL